MVVYDAGVLPAAFLLAPLLASPPPLAWREIDLEARRFFMEARARITVERCPVDSVAAQLVTPPLGSAVVPVSGMVDVVRIEARLPFHGAERMTVWLDAVTGRALQNEKRRLGKGAYWKLRRMTDDGYYEWRTEPDAPGDAALDPREWSDRVERRVVFDPQPPSGTVVTDPYALLVALPLLESAGRPVAVVAGRLAVPVAFEPGGEATVSAKVRLQWPGGGRTLRRAGVRTVRVRVHPPPGVEEHSVHTGVFGLRGDLEITMTGGTALPIAVRGKVPSLGRLTIHLERAELQVAPEGTDAGK